VKDRGNTDEVKEFTYNDDGSYCEHITSYTFGGATLDNCYEKDYDPYQYSTNEKTTDECGRLIEHRYGNE
jgi:hypothetical protein